MTENTYRTEDTPCPQYLPDVNRVEVIDDTGRAYQGHELDSVCISIQDSGHTMKIFIKGKAS